MEENQINQHLNAHKHGPRSNFFDPSNPVFDKNHTEERAKQILTALFLLSAFIFLVWFVLQAI